jgi:arginase
MSVATMLGWCHTTESARLQGFAPLDASRILFVGTRDLDPPEAAAAARFDMKMLAPSELAGVRLERAVDGFASKARRAYVHIDLDVLDPATHGAANPFAAPGGLSAEQVVTAVRAVSARCALAGFTFSAYDPAVDAAGSVRAAAIQVAAAILPRQEVSPPG